MTDKKLGESRRKLLKSIAAGSGVAVASKSIPESWSRPVVNSVMLPAHASATGTFQITAQLTNTASDQCGSFGETFRIDGTVQANNGVDLTGVLLNLHYTDNPPDGDFVNFEVAIQSGNTYSFTTVAVATVGQWDAPPYQVVVTFLDQATYGNASVTVTGFCGNLTNGEAKAGAY